MTHRLTLLLALASAGAAAQSIRVYSEFQRIDPFGAIVRADRAESPREILSPGLARNAYASFQVVVSVPDGRPWSLYLAQNPDHIVRVTLYQPRFEKHGDTWIPDALDQVTLSDSGAVPPLPVQVPGQTVQTWWMDLWVPGTAPVRRTRLELQLNTADRWIIYPMELRLLSPVIPALDRPFTPLPPPEASAAESAAGPLRAYLCAGPAPIGEQGPVTIRRQIRRNARQDIALARALEATSGKTELAAKLLERAGLPDAKPLCAGPLPPGPAGGEWYLKLRDYLYRAASR